VSTLAIPALLPAARMAFSRVSLSFTEPASTTLSPSTSTFRSLVSSPVLSMLSFNSAAFAEFDLKILSPTSLM
jgi:hypothetical protein